MADQKTALITGASFGIGQELARIFAREGHSLVLVARSGDKLRQLASDLEKAHGTRSLILATDLTEPGAPAYVLDQTTRADIQVDVLVNNAGFGQFGFFAENDLEICLQQIQLNVTTLTHLTRLLLPAMIERHHGRILNVASTAAFQAGPLMAVYYATKAYVLLFSEAIANELQGTGVTVTCLCPGVTTTEFHKRANMTNSRLLQFGSMDARTVAELGYRGLMQGRPVVIAGFKNWLLAQSVRFSPRQMVTAVARKLQESRSQ
ncbi:MAG: SDR family oxidoreductase [Terriglobales bacterium]